MLCALTNRFYTMNQIQNILNQFPLMILDGAFATELEKRGCDLNHSLWSAKVLMESPEMIAEVHSDYFHAGADCVITASYQATVEGFRRQGLSERNPCEAVVAMEKGFETPFTVKELSGRLLIMQCRFRYDD